MNTTAETKIENTKIELGKSGVLVSSLGLGTWAWGDHFYWGYGKGYGENDLHAAFDESLRAGIDFLDTAEVYGFGNSEKFIGKFLHAATRDQNPTIHNGVHVATKFFPLPWRLTRRQIVRALRASLKRLRVECVDLYQIHWPTPLLSVETMMDALAECVEKGLARAVGVSNFNAAQTRRAHARLAKYNIPLASDQIEYNLLRRNPDFSGLRAACDELGVTVIAYSPLKYGMLTGKYTPANPPPGARGRQFNAAYLTQIQPLMVALREVADKCGKTRSQVALRWVMQRGALPIPGAKNLKQARENAGALGWALRQDDVELLSEISERVTRSR